VDRRTRILFAGLLVAIVVATVVTALVLSEPPTEVNPSPSGQLQEMVGVVVAVESEGLADVQGFTLRRSGGELVEFSLDALENGMEFPPGHLSEHQATAEPVRVWFRTESGEMFAIRLEDAPV
jgi:hypothetical protein